MANYVDPTIDMLLTRFPEHFKLAAQTPSSESSSSVQASAAHPETSQKLKDAIQSKRPPIKDGGPHVDERPFPISGFPANKGPCPTLTDSTPPKGFGSWSFGHDSDIEAATEAAATKASTEAADTGTATEAAATKASTEAAETETATEAATPSKSEKVKAEASLTELIELARKDDRSSDKIQEQSLSDLPPHLPASSDKSFTKRRTSPPLGHALARRASVLNHPKPTPSRLRNEIYRSPVDDDESAHIKGEERRVDANSLEQPDGCRGRSADKKAISGFGKEVDMAKADEVAENAHLPEKSHAQGEGTTKANTTKKRPWISNDDLIVPPIVLGKEKPEDPDWNLYIPSVAEISVTFRDPSVGLSAHELVKVPQELKHIDPDILMLYWDIAYTPAVRKTVLAFKHKLAQAGEADKKLNLPNRLLISLVEAQEEENHKGAKHIVDASDIKINEYKESVAATTKKPARLPDTQEDGSQEIAKNNVDANNIKASEHKQSLPATIKLSTQFSVTTISLAAVFEFQRALADPTYDITTRRQFFALYNGVKLDSTVTNILMDYYTNLLPHHPSSNTASAPNDKDKLVSGRLDSMELEAPYQGKGKESDLPVEGKTFSSIEGEEKDLPVEGSPIDSGQGKENAAGNGKVKGKGKKNKGKRKNKGKGKGGSESLMDDAAPDKDEGKDRDTLMEDSAVGKGKCKDNELPLEDATTGKGKAEESEALLKHPGTGKGRIEGQGFGILSIKTGDLNDKIDVLLEFDMAKALVSTGRVAKENIREEMNKVYITVLDEAKALFLDPQSVGFIKSMGLKPNNASKSTASNAPPYDTNVLRDLLQFPLTDDEQTELIIFLKVYTLMENYIRPQTASISQVKLACELLRGPRAFAALGPLIEELNWSRAIIGHPSNPMITCILLDTQEQRPNTGYRHSSGVFVIPPPTPRYPPLPPGLAPATPVVNMPKKKQPMMGRGGVPAPVQVKLPFEDLSDVLVLREATVEAMTKGGMPLRDAQVSADVVAMKQSEQYLQEKAKKPIVGGTAVDLQVERQKKRGLKGLAAGNEFAMEMLAMRQGQMFERS